MRKWLMLCLLSTALWAAPGPRPQVKVHTDMGAFVIQLEPEAAPKTVANFLNYVRMGFYNGTIFHRVIPGLMIQGGGHLPDLTRKPAGAPIPNEADTAKAHGMLNTRGTVAMALPAGNPLGGTCQFFVNVKDNPSLNFKARTLTDYGYCPFGRVVQGMDVVDRIRRVPTRKQGGMADVPVRPVTIIRVEELR